MSEKVLLQVKQVDGLKIPEAAHNTDAGVDITAVTEPNIVGEGNLKDGFSRIDYIEYGTNLFIAPVCGCVSVTKGNEDGDKTSFTWVQTGIYHTLIYPRSSISKYNLLLCNSVGIIDFAYRGEIKVRFKYIFQPEDLFVQGFNLKTKVNLDKIYKKGDKICQMQANPNRPIEFLKVDNLDQTVRGAGGFGSTSV